MPATVVVIVAKAVIMIPPFIKARYARAYSISFSPCNNPMGVAIIVGSVLKRREWRPKRGSGSRLPGLPCL